MKSVKGIVRNTCQVWMDSFVELNVRRDVDKRLCDPIRPIIADQMAQNTFIGLLPK